MLSASCVGVKVNRAACVPMCVNEFWMRPICGASLLLWLPAPSLDSLIYKYDRSGPAARLMWRRTEHRLQPTASERTNKWHWEINHSENRPGWWWCFFLTRTRWRVGLLGELNDDLSGKRWRNIRMYFLRYRIWSWISFAESDFRSANIPRICTWVVYI